MSFDLRPCKSCIFLICVILLWRMISMPLFISKNCVRVLETFLSWSGFFKKDLAVTLYNVTRNTTGCLNENTAVTMHGIGKAFSVWITKFSHLHCNIVNFVFYRKFFISLHVLRNVVVGGWLGCIKGNWSLGTYY